MPAICQGQSDAPIPVDLVTNSASGLDPDITPGGGRIPGAAGRQGAQPAGRQGPGAGRRNTEGRLLGILGEPRVNVLKLNLALDALLSRPTRYKPSPSLEGGANGTGPSPRFARRGARTAPRCPIPTASFARCPARAANSAQRGRLKIFLGAAPGVGKTYEMLPAAQAVRKDGVDVVVGVVETHERRRDRGAARGARDHPAAAHRL